MSLISDNIWSEVSGSFSRGDMRPRPLGVIISGCELSITKWLEDLHESGIDLAEYGSNEQRACQQPARTAAPLLFPSIFSHSVGDFILEGSFRLACSLQLIKFQYGRLPKDWKFWWNEPSDEFAGEFWSAFESEEIAASTSMPGTWID